MQGFTSPLKPVANRPLIRSQEELREAKDREVAARKEQEANKRLSKNRKHGQKSVSKSLSWKRLGRQMSGSLGKAPPLSEEQQEEMLSQYFKSIPIQSGAQTVKGVSKELTEILTRTGHIWGNNREERFMMHPSSRKRLTWGTIISCSLLYVGVVTPYRVGFRREARGAFFILENIIDCSFIIDLFLNFRTGIIDSNGKPVLSPTIVAKHYIKGWFWADLVASIPYQWIMKRQGDLLETSRLTRVSRIFKIMRLSKLTKVFQMTTVFEAIEDISITWRHYFKMLKMVLLAGVTTHLTACVWAFVGNESEIYGGKCLEEGYDYDASAARPSQPWFCEYSHLPWSEASSAEQYVLAMYFALTTILTVGFGDITPATHTERIVAMIVMIIGCRFDSSLLPCIAVRHRLFAKLYERCVDSGLPRTAFMGTFLQTCRRSCLR